MLTARLPAKQVVQALIARPEGAAAVRAGKKWNQNEALRIMLPALVLRSREIGSFKACPISWAEHLCTRRWQPTGIFFFQAFLLCLQTSSIRINPCVHARLDICRALLAANADPGLPDGHWTLKISLIV